MQSALLIVGHGSRDPDGTREFLQLVELLRQRQPDRIIEPGFLEFAHPIIAAGIDRCIERGAKSITVLPGMLTAAGHTKNDIPSEIHEAAQRYPDVEFRYGRHLHTHAKLIELCQLRLEQAERSAKPIPRSETLLLLVGRGSSDPDANADVLKIARMLCEGMGYGWPAVAYIGVTTPLLDDALRRCGQFGFRRIIVFSYFLFTGVLEKRIRRTTEEFAQAQAALDVVYAGYLNAHPYLADAFADRADEAIHGEPNMNCALCKYRVRLPGFEHQVGEPQVGHHHHVRGAGQHTHHHHHHDHDHDHHHEHDHRH
ncbi:MAG: sirohydrochlorin cobaltochelatase [Gemmatales bacterium]|nr:MAG: sirohydrochlorin cobaltochelatase [Gemmatales bacterium]